jgi:hypothetical protein
MRMRVTMKLLCMVVFTIIVMLGANMWGDARMVAAQELDAQHEEVATIVCVPESTPTLLGCVGYVNAVYKQWRRDNPYVTIIERKTNYSLQAKTDEQGVAITKPWYPVYAITVFYRTSEPTNPVSSVIPQ